MNQNQVKKMLLNFELNEYYHYYSPQTHSPEQVPGKQSRNSSAGAEYTLGCGHSSHVTNVRWTNDDKFIITTGGEDQCIIIWKVDKADP